MDTLNDRQKRFCDEYLVDSDATKAALRAGYSPKTARNACKWLNEGNPQKPSGKFNPEMRAYIDDRLAQLHSKKTADAQEVLEYLTSVMRGNDYSDTCIPIEYVKGLETCTVTALLIPGEDEEATEIFRQRYFSSLHAQAFGGNRQDYIEKVNAIPGVGAVKVYRAWNSDIAPASLLPPEGTDAWLETLPGIPEEIKNWLDTMYLAASQSKLTVGGTVKLVILDSTLSKPSSTLVELVQTTIDPTQNAGEGLGLAPIGHVVKVYGADEEVINLDFAVYCRRGLAWEDVCDAAADAVKDYFRELTQSWADTDGPLIVRVAQVESHLLTVPGILDVGRTALNGREVNLTLTSDHIPVLGTISAHAAAIS